MTDDAHMSSDDETTNEQKNNAESAAFARKRRLMALKTKIHGVEMKEEDYVEEEKVTKKAKTGTSTFRSYQPPSDDSGTKEPLPLNLLELEIKEHLEETKDTKPIDNIELSTLAPKKIDWDLKRDIEPKLKKLERKTQKAIAEIIRQRLAEGHGDLATTVNTVSKAAM